MGQNNNGEQDPSSNLPILPSSAQLKHLDSLMLRMKKNFEQQKNWKQSQQKKKSSPIDLGQDGSVEGANMRQENSYKFFANQTQSQPSGSKQFDTDPQLQHHHLPEPHFRRPQEVKIEFLRSANNSGGAPASQVIQRQKLVPHDNKRFKNGNLAKYQQPLSNSTQTLFLLNYHQHLIVPQTMSLDGSKSEANSLIGDDLEGATSNRQDERVELAEQQQQAPQTQAAPFNLLQLLQQQQPQAQQGFSAPQAPLLQDPRIRQMLSNYQRYGAAGLPSGAQLGDYQRQLLTQLNPRPPELHLRPPATNNQQVGQNQQPQQQQQQQQPFSALQFFTNPLQALLPGLQQPQTTSNQAQVPPAVTIKSPDQPASNLDTQRGEKATRTHDQAAQQPRAPFNMMNPFGLNAQTNREAANQAQRPAPNLQELYQQLPIYQALLAFRQRQQALQEAQRLQQGLANGGVQPIMPPPQQLPSPGHPSGEPPGAAPPPFAGPLPALNLLQPLQPPPQQQQQTPPPMQQQPHLPGSVQQGPWLGQQAAQPQQNGNSNGGVQFDDDNQQRQPQPTRNEQNTNPQSAVNGHNNQAHNNEDQNQQGEDGNDNRNDNNNHEDQNAANNNDANNNDHPQDNGQNHSQGNSNHDEPNQNDQGEQGGGSGAQAEAEDPDLKQFQNFANGGDSFTDLFPPGILSNNDINEIKSEQDKQNKKQEEEERQRQLQQQGQQDSNGPGQSQTTGGNGGGGQEEQNDANGQDGAGQQPDGGNSQGDENQPDGEEGGDQEEPEQPEEENGSQEQPTAAALTSKAGPIKGPEGHPLRPTTSPGVEYAGKG